MVHLRKLFQTFMVNAFLKIIYCGLNHSFEELIEDQLPDDGNMTFIRPVRGVDKYTNTIRFNIPDLTVMHKVNDVDIDLHAYKVEGHDHENQWVSIGHPFLIKNKNGGIYQFTPESIFMKLRLLAEDQRTALKNIAKQFYPNIKEALIYLIPLQSLSCATSFLAGEETIELQGKANNLNQYEVTVEIPCEEHSSVRNAFLNRIKRADSINWRCTFSADGKRQFVNSIQISAEDMQDAVIDHNLFGPADEVYVTRNQFTTFSQKIRSSLQVQEDYELDGKFDEALIEKLISTASVSFKYVDIDQVFTKISKFGFSMNERDLTPDEMKRHLSDMMVVEKHGDKHSITLKNDEKRAGGEENENSEKYGAALSVGTKFGIDANAEFIKKEGHRWENANTSTLEQLSDMNSDDRNHVKYEFVGSKLVPKAVKVARLHKNDLKKDVSISYKRVMRKNANFRKEIFISTDGFQKAADTFQELKKDFDEYKSTRGILLENLNIDYSKDLGELGVKAKAISSKVSSLNAKLKRKSSFYVSDQVECKNKTKTESYDSSYQVVEYDCESSFGKEYFLQNTKTTINGNSRSQTHEFDCCRRVFHKREAYVSS